MLRNVFESPLDNVTPDYLCFAVVEIVLSYHIPKSQLYPTNNKKKKKKNVSLLK